MTAVSLSCLGCAVLAVPPLTEPSITGRGDIDPRAFARVRSQWPRLRTLMARYERMDLADACIVAMTERYRRSRVLTVDRRDFSTYRRNDRQVIDFIVPPER